MLKYTLVVAVSLLVACNGVSTAQSLQAPAPVFAPAGMCDAGPAAGQLTVTGTGTVSVTSDVATVRLQSRNRTSHVILAPDQEATRHHIFQRICDHAP